MKTSHLALNWKLSCSDFFLLLLLPFLAVSSSAATFTNDTLIDANNTNFDGQDIVATNCTVTIDGPHYFSSVHLLNASVLTHSYSANGYIQNLISISNESHTISSTNPAALLYTNVLQTSVIVSDLSGKTYLSGTDYSVGLSNTTTLVSLVSGSTIPDGASVLISYQFFLPPVATGVQLFVTNNFEIEPGAAIEVSGKGFGPGYGPAPGLNAFTNYPYNFRAGGGGGHGGSGGASSISTTAGGAANGSLLVGAELGSGGGAGTDIGGAGGGRVDLNVGGLMRVDGRIGADGANGVSFHSGGGAGGGLRLIAQLLSGSGTLSANGGAGDSPDGGSGGGGRLAIYYGTNLFAGAMRARGGVSTLPGGAGTIYSIANNQTNGTLVVDNGGVRGAPTLLSVNFGYDLNVSGGAVAQASSLLNVGNLFIGSNSWITPQPQLRVSLTVNIAGDAVLQAGGGISADNNGFPGGVGPGVGRTFSSTAANGGITGGGGGYGGYGGTSITGALGGAYYGSIAQPGDLGSGGGNGGGLAPYNVGGAGGGALRVTVAGTLTLNGQITANGQNGLGQGSGGGSGGSLWLTLGNLAGTGLLAANGGSGELPLGGGGGGGRIALYYTSNSFTGMISAHGGPGANYGGAGTVYSKPNSNAYAQLVINNSGYVGTNTPLSFVPGSFDLTITGDAIATAVNSLSLGNLTIRSNSSLTSSNINRTAVSIYASNATIDASSAINLNGQGWPAGQGPGLGRFLSGGGGGYGGYGGNGLNATNGGGVPYGIISTPIDLGSGGAISNALSPAGAGGGALHLILGTLALDGAITANGSAAQAPGLGGGAGGALWLAVGRLTGAGTISANGGAGGFNTGGGGGGGRIALYYTSNLFTGTISASGGPGANYGGAGTIYLSPNNQQVAQIVIDNAGGRGTNTPLSLQTFANITVSGGATVLATAFGPIGNLLINSNSSLIYSNFIRTPINISSNLIIQSGGALLADGAGYAAGIGPGAGRYLFTQTFGYISGGGGYGGYGGSGPGAIVGGVPYGFLAQPTDLGSGGALVADNSGGGAGGGALQLNVTGTLNVDGSLTSNGKPASGSGGGGSGGSLWLTVGTLSGSGLIAANGGAGNPLTGGGGGGGRISIRYNTTNRFAGTLSARGGPGAMPGGAGTIYLVGRFGQSIGQVTVDNGGQRGTNTVLSLSSAQGPIDLTVSGGAVLNAPYTDIQLALGVRNLLLTSNAWITAPTNTTLQLNIFNNATVQAGGGIIVDAQSTRGLSPGGIIFNAAYGYNGGGGGYGGYGASSIAGAPGGLSYGSLLQPIDLGSAGGAIQGAPIPAGGGSIKVTVTGTLALDGIISANGTNGTLEGSGGGSGGGIWLTAGVLSGSGAISANGGAGDPGQGGGGGGGRIAIYYGTNNFHGPISAYGGSGVVYGGAGTIYQRANNKSTGTLVIDNAGNSGTNTPLSAPEAFAASILGGALVYPSSPLVLSGLLIDTGGTLTQLSGRTNPLDLTILGNATVQTNGSINVDAKGYNGISGGPGVGQSSVYGGGGGYGGAGGAGLTNAAGGITYGSAFQPVDPGSRGGLNPLLPGFCQGGGALVLRVSGDLTVNGRVSANGNDAHIEGAGGGSGGSVWLTARQFDGVGYILANGGLGEDSGGGGGGGGRIAINTISNNYSGIFYAMGGMGGSEANPGQNGTVVVTNIPAPQIISQNPVGAVDYVVSYVDLGFSSPMDLSTVAPTDFNLDTPNGLLSQSSLLVSNSSLTSLRLSFPPQSDIGYYQVNAGPQIQDIYGQPMAATYSGYFVILAPVISGHVFDTNGLPVAYVTIRPDDGLLPTLTDTNGLYSIQVPPGWTGTITPSKGTAMFIPNVRSYTNVSADLPNQNFIMATAPLLTLKAVQQGSTMNLNFYCLNGVTYELLYSTDLVNWSVYGTWSGTNNPVSVSVSPNAGQQSQQMFFRFNAIY